MPPLCESEIDDNDCYLRYCKPCLASKPELEITLLPPTRKSSRKRARLDYANIEAGLPSDQGDPNRWLDVIRDKAIHPDTFRRMKGAELTREWLDQDPLAMTEPVVIESAEGLGMRMPDKEFTVDKVAELVGPDTPLEVMGECFCDNRPARCSQRSRCGESVNIPWVDTGLLGGLLQHPRIHAGQNSERHFS